MKDNLMTLLINVSGSSWGFFHQSGPSASSEPESDFRPSSFFFNGQRNGSSTKKTQNKTKKTMLRWHQLFAGPELLRPTRTTKYYDSHVNKSRAIAAFSPFYLRQNSNNPSCNIDVKPKQQWKNMISVFLFFFFFFFKCFRIIHPFFECCTISCLERHKHFLLLNF